MELSDKSFRGTIRFGVRALIACAAIFFAAVSTAELPATNPSPAPEKPVAKLEDFFAKLKNLNLSLAQSYDSFQKGGSPYAADGTPNFEPATFSLTHSPHQDVVYKTQYFLGWRPLGDRPLGGDQNGKFPLGEWTPLVSAEGNFSSDKNDAADAVRFRATAHGVFGPANQDQGNLRGLRVDASVKYEASRTFNTQKMLGEFQFRPTFTALGIGRRWPHVGVDPITGHLDPTRLANEAPFQVLWTPWLGVDVGKTLDQPKPTGANASQEAKRDLLRVYGAIDATLYLNKATEILGAKDVYLSAGEKFYYLPHEHGETHNFLEFGAHFVLTKNASIDVTYDIGRDSPDFKKQEVLTVGFGLRF